VRCCRAGGPIQVFEDARDNTSRFRHSGKDRTTIVRRLALIAVVLVAALGLALWAVFGSRAESGPAGGEPRPVQMTTSSTPDSDAAGPSAPMMPAGHAAEERAAEAGAQLLPPGPGASGDAMVTAEGVHALPPSEWQLHRTRKTSARHGAPREAPGPAGEDASWDLPDAGEVPPSGDAPPAHEAAPVASEEPPPTWEAEEVFSEPETLEEFRVLAEGVESEWEVPEVVDEDWRPTAPAEQASGEDLQEDLEGPVLRSLRFYPSEVLPGQGTTVIVGVEDTRSQVLRVMGLLQELASGATLPFGCQPGRGASDCRARVVLPEDAQLGAWVVESMTAVDAAGNEAQFLRARSPALREAFLEVLSKEGDETPPWLESAAAAPATVAEGETFILTVKVGDEGMGVQGVWGQYAGPPPTQVVSFQGRPASEAGVFHAKVNLPRDAKEGLWGITGLKIEDGAGNHVRVVEGDPLLVAATVMVVPSSGDTTPPKVAQIQVDPPTVERGQIVELTVEVRETESGPSLAVATVGDLANNLEKRIDLRLLPDVATFHALVSVPSDAPVGPWGVLELTLYDRAENARTYRVAEDPELEEGKFEVY